MHKNLIKLIVLTMALIVAIDNANAQQTNPAASARPGCGDKRPQPSKRLTI